jgi:hypothetical protein
MTPERPQPYSLTSTMRNTLGANGVLNTGESPEPLVASRLYFIISHSYLQCHQGTPAFIARAVQLGGPVPPNKGLLDIPEVPMIAGRYETCHPDRITKFPYRPRNFSIISTDGADPQWRHELDHDTESLFWVLLYWVTGAQPENEEKELIGASFWPRLTGSVDDRIDLLQGRIIGATHSVYRPIWPLLQKLADIISVDGHWVEASDPRKDPGYINEACRRLILQFILEHRNENFMQHRVESQPRLPEVMSGLLSLSSDTSHGRKRSLSEPSIRGGTKRIRVAEKTIEVGRRCPRCVCFNGGFSGFPGQRRKRESVCKRRRRKVGWSG